MPLGLPLYKLVGKIFTNNLMYTNLPKALHSHWQMQTFPQMAQEESYHTVQDSSPHFLDKQDHEQRPKILIIS